MKKLSIPEMEEFMARHPKAIARIVQRRRDPPACSDKELRSAMEELDSLTGYSDASDD